MGVIRNVLRPAIRSCFEGRICARRLQLKSQNYSYYIGSAAAEVFASLEFVRIFENFHWQYVLKHIGHGVTSGRKERGVSGVAEAGSTELCELSAAGRIGSSVTQIRTCK